MVDIVISSGHGLHCRGAEGYLDEVDCARVVVDRTAAIRQLERIEQAKAQEIQIDNNSRHKKGEVIHIQLTDVGQRALILVNIAGDGVVQMLYPTKASDARIIPTANFDLPLRIQEPFGGDNLVAVTSQQPMAQLEQALRCRAPLAFIQLFFLHLTCDQGDGLYAWTRFPVRAKGRDLRMMQNLCNKVVGWRSRS